MTLVLYAEFFFRFFIIFGLVISLILTIALFLKMRHRKYLIELLILGVLVFIVFWIIHQFNEIIFISSKLIDVELGDDLISNTFALMGAIMIFSISIVKNRLKKL